MRLVSRIAIVELGQSVSLEEAMSTYTHHHQTATIPLASRDAAWFVFGSAIAFAIPFLGVSVLDLQHDLYYLAYCVVTLALLASYVRVEQIDVVSVFRRQWRWSVGIGVVLAAFLVFNVLHGSAATARPHGTYFVFELAWRGLGYGIIDALLLTAFPGIVAYRILHGRISGMTGRLRYLALALPLIIIITATYHWGYPQIRQDGLTRPETGNTLISIPMLATANPAGSIIAHASMHITAVTHAYETRDYLPPVTKVNH
jgi:hypothetical protein